MGQDLIKTKKIEYRGGILTFEIPSNWKEEYDNEGGAAFYEDNENSGTLFLHLLTLESPEKISKDSTKELLEPILENQEIKVLPNQNVIKYYKFETQEKGVKLITYWWSLAQIVESNKGRIANFSFVIPENTQNEKNVMDQIEFINSMVESAIFVER